MYSVHILLDGHKYNFSDSVEENTIRSETTVYRGRFPSFNFQKVSLFLQWQKFENEDNE